MVELGTRHECEECGTKFYDLGSSVICCPKCSWNPDAPKVEEVASGDPDSEAPAKKATKKKATKKKATKKKATKKKVAKRKKAKKKTAHKKA